MTRDEALGHALALPDALAQAHFDRMAVRAGKGRIFATVGTADVNLRLTPDEQALFVDSAPVLVAPVAGGWGRQGWTRLALDGADEALLHSLLAAAWRGAAPAKLRQAHPDI